MGLPSMVATCVLASMAAQLLAALVAAGCCFSCVGVLQASAANRVNASSDGRFMASPESSGPRGASERRTLERPPALVNDGGQVAFANPEIEEIKRLLERTRTVAVVG